MHYVDEDIWVEDAELRLAGTAIGIRSTICRLADGAVWVHSPVPLDDEIQHRIAEIGPVGHLVTGANGHNLYLMDWVAAYPHAAVHVTRGIPKRLKDLHEYRFLNGTEFPHDFDCAAMGNVPFFDEHVFFHRRSKSLIVTDFIQHHPAEARRGFVARYILAPLGFKDICIAPPLRLKSTVKDKDAFAAFCRRLRSFDVARVIVTHGPIIEDDANGVIHRLTERFL